MENIIDNCSEIESVIAMIRHFSPNQPIEDAVIYFWESHTDSNNDVRKIDATVDLIYKEFNISTCEKYEVRTGYLSRYNFLQQSIIHCSAEEIERAIVLGKKEEENWINRCQPQLPDFNLMDWKECISEEKNPFLSGCEELILDKIENCEEFKNAFQKSVNDFARKHNTDVYNGHMYILEETSWILTLPLLHPDKPIYLVHVDTANEAVEATFQHFPNLKKAVRWLSPRFITAVFKNTIDFLLDYRNNKHAGYSYATKNKDILKIFKRKTKTVNNTNTLLSMFEYVDAERRLLRSIIGKLPGHVYWLNSENTYLGCNDLQARLLNLQSREEIIGKTNYDFHNKEEAERINKINKEVMETGVPYEGEEFSSTPIGRLRNYISQKVPLYDTYGKSIGLLGLSIDITDRKKAEELEKKLAIQKELYEIAKRVAHDICSPLSALEIVKYMSLDKLNSEEKKMFELSIRSIKDIAGSLTTKYRNRNKEGVDETCEEEEYIAPYTMKDLIDGKRYGYHDKKDLEINFNPDENNKFVFIRGNYSDFSRMMANLISNGVESIEGKEGKVEVSYEVKGEEVEVKVKDNGSGMSKEMVGKINRGEAVGTTKEKGNGIGMEQIIKTIKDMKGQLEVKSVEGEGTEFIMRFKKVEAPKWFARKIEIKKGDTVVVLDEEVLIHEVLKRRFKGYEKDLTIKYFTEGLEVINFINSIEDKSKVFLIGEYELKNQEINGIEVIEKSGMKERHVLVTGKNLSEIKEFKEKSNFIKIFSKMYINDIDIIVV